MISTTIKNQLGIANPKYFLKQTLKYFINQTNYIPIIATEIEFYITVRKINAENSYSAQDNVVANSNLLNTLFNSIEQRLIQKNISTGKIKPELGLGQYEINLTHSKNILKIAEDTENLVNIITEEAENLNLYTNFDAKPYLNNDMGSALHLHLSLHKENINKNINNDLNLSNIFSLNQDISTTTEYNNLLLHSIGGIIDLSKASTILFCHHENNLLRFTPFVDLTIKEKRKRPNTTQSPTHIAWGYDNRTTLIRIPPYTDILNDLRLEHRLASSNSNPALAISGLLIGTLHGLKHKITPPPKIYGQAFDPQYKLLKLSSNLDEIINDYQSHQILQQYIQEIKQLNL